MLLHIFYDELILALGAKVIKNQITFTFEAEKADDNYPEMIVRGDNFSPADADKYLNEVRARAFGVKPTDLGAHKKTASLDTILEERRLEFAMEGNRFFDLVRFGKADEVLGAKGYTASKRYIPIPQSEIDKAEGTLKQNNY